MPSILPSDNAPSRDVKYMNPDAVRQLLRQERLRWHLKVNKDVDYHDKTRDSRYASELINEGYIQRMEIRAFANTNTYAGYAGLTSDVGNADNKGFVHGLEKWDRGVSDESKEINIHRTTIGASAIVPELSGYGLDDHDNISTTTSNRMSAVLFDPYDGRAYLFTNDEPYYINNASAAKIRPARTIARLADIPTRITQLDNDLSFISDPAYVHTENNFSNSNRFVVDNLDDRTFVYPEIAQNSDGDYINNLFTNPDGSHYYPRYNDTDPSNYNDGYIPGIFTSIEQLESVDLIHQRRPLRNDSYPDAKRDSNYYIHDGVWNTEWINSTASFKTNPLIPDDMETYQADAQPTPYQAIDTSIVEEISKDGHNITVNKLHQWRYNRVEISYPSENITVTVTSGGTGYAVGDILQWSYGNDIFSFEVTGIIGDGAINTGHYIVTDEVFNEDPSTRTVEVSFVNTTGSGHDAKFTIDADAKIEVYTTQLKNNLYAYVNVGKNDKLLDTGNPWIDDLHTGINKGRGCSSPNDAFDTSEEHLKEHTGAEGAGLQVHLFRYVIDTKNPTFESIDGYPVFTGKWVDQGPLGIERPQDIKALLFANPDTNNFNNYYKFMTDLMIDKLNRNPDAVETANPNTFTIPLLHIDKRDPTETTRFTDKTIDPQTNEIIDVDVTHRVIYVNASTGVWFIYNTGVKADMEFGYASTPIGWIPIAGAVSK